jgi:hypothetical protein
VKGDAGKGVVLVDRLAPGGGGDWVIFPKPSVGAILGTGELKGDIGTGPALPVPPMPKPPAKANSQMITIGSLLSERKP